MAKDDDKPLLKAEYRADQARLIDGLTQDLQKARASVDDAMAAALKDLAATFARNLEGLDAALEKRLSELEDAASAPGERGAGVDRRSIVAKRERAEGTAVLLNGSAVLFRPHDGSGPKEGWAAIVCGGRVIRPGYPALYTLWVLEPRKARWEENVKEGDGLGTFAVA